jgi:hypothetical protein
MLQRLVGYAYTWDYAGDAAAAPRAATLGLSSVAVAANYHATRAATPLHPAHRIHDAEHAACYVPVREQAWHGHRLVPAVPSWDPNGDSFASAQGQLLDQGLEVEAWIVLTHNSTLGRAHPDLVVRNAFGDVYPYALCPAATDVQEYCLTLVEEVLRSAPMDGIVLEACGPMGLDHAGKHEKTEFAGWDEVGRALLSLCFCQACEGRYAAAGVDSDRLAQVVREGVDSGSGPSKIASATGWRPRWPPSGSASPGNSGSCWWPGADRSTRASGSRWTARATLGPLGRSPPSSRRWAKASMGSSRPAGTLLQEADASRTCVPWPLQAPRWAPTSGWTAGGRRTRGPVAASRST